MPTRKTFDRLNAKSRREIERLIVRAARENVSALRAVRNAAAENVLKYTNVYNLPAFRQQTKYSFENFADVLAKKVDKQLEKAWNLGSRAIDDPLSKTGHDLRVSALPRSSFDSDKLRTYREEIKNTIQQIAADGARRVNNAATFGILGDRDKKQIEKDIGRYITRGAMKKVAGQVESMTRTETARVFNLSMRDRLKQAGKEISGVKKFWQHIDDGKARPAHRDVGYKTNPEFGGKPVAYNSDFRVGGESAFAPYDPRLSDGNIYGCRCALGFFVEQEEIQYSSTRPIFGERGF